MTLIEFLKGQENLGLNEPAIKILENEEAFLNITEEKLKSYDMIRWTRVKSCGLR
jgi:hypothetical protein